MRGAGASFRLEGVSVRLGSEWALREVDLVRVKGKDEPAAIFEALGYHTEATFPAREQTLAAFAEGLAAYRDQENLL